MRTARDLALAGLAVLVVGTWWLRRYPEAPAQLFDPCLLRTVWGVPCPTCGGTRAVLALAHGQPLAALQANPLVCVVVVGFGIWAVGSLVPRWRRRLTTAPVAGRRLVIIAVTAILANWLWVAFS